MYLAAVCAASGALAQTPGPRLRVYRKVAGASCFLPDDTFYRTDREWARHLPRGAFLFGAHGKPGRLEQADYDATIRKLIPRMRRSGHVFLHVCDAGLPGPDGSPSIALRVARDTGRPVVAPAGSIMGNPCNRGDGMQELVQVVLRTDGGRFDLVDKAEAWKVVYPDGRERPLRVERYFRKAVPLREPRAPAHE